MQTSIRATRAEIRNTAIWRKTLWAACLAFTLAGALAEALTLTAVQSRKAHGAAGSFDTSVDITQTIGGAVTVESRAIGAGHQIVFKFDGPVATYGTPLAFDETGAPIGTLMALTAGNDVVVTLTNVPDNKRIRLVLPNVNGAGDAVVSLGFLVGDVNNSRSVSTVDVQQLKARSGQGVDAANFRFDLNASGVISAADVSAVKSRSPRNLPDATVPVTFTLNVGKTGAGFGTVTSSPPGIDCGADCSEVYLASTAVTLTATANTGSAFAGWSGGGCSGTGTCAMTMDAVKTVTATFTLNSYAVIPSAGANGTISPSGIQMVNHGATTSFTVTPSVGYTASMSGSCGGTLVGTTYTTDIITGICSVSANFTLNTYLLTVTPAGSGSGSVTSGPAGINCPGDCTEIYNHGTMVTLTAASGASSTFGGWGGACTGTGTCVVAMDAAKTVSANFNLIRYALTVSKTGTGTGTVTSSPPGIDCGADCSEGYDTGTAVALTAMPSAGSTFSGWGGACAGTGTCMISMKSALSVSASFTLGIETSVAALTIGEAGSGTFGVRLTAQPAATTAVTVTSSNTAAAIGSPASLTFTTTDWNIYQTVTVSGVADVNLTDESATISAASTGLTTRTVAVTVTDDDVQDITLSATALTVGEVGTGTFTARLAFQPGANVTVTLASSNTLAATVSPALLTFTPANYAITQTVTVSGVTDANAANELVTISAASTGLTTRTVAVTVTDDDILGLETSVAALTIGEAGTGMFGVRLTAQPAATTTVTVASSDTAAVIGSPASLTFTTADWNTYQTVTVGGVADVNLTDESVTLSATSTGLTTRTVAVTVTDDDVQDITLSTPTLTVGEAGSGTFTVRLAFQPSASVTVTLASSNTLVATVAPALLTFTPANYAITQTVTVSGVTDANAANESATISAASTGLTTRTVAVTVTDDDVQDITLSATTLTVGEASSGTFTVRLAFQPSANVTVTLASSNTAAATVAPALLTFAPADYLIAQTVTVSGVADVNVANESATLSAASIGLTTKNVAVTVIDDDYTLSVSTTGAGAGTVTSSPAGIDCGMDCSENYNSGTLVTLTATPIAGSAFSAWGGACSGTVSTCDVTMDAVKSVSADFTLLNTNPTCTSNQLLTPISGDTGAEVRATSGVGEKWLRVRITENDSSIVAKYLSATITLTSPPGADYNLYVYCVICGGLMAGASTSTAQNDVVHVRMNEEVFPTGLDNSFDVLIEVRYFGGSSSSIWNLSVVGNTSVSSPTCPF